jgi:hypothetical protein
LLLVATKSTIASFDVRAFVFGIEAVHLVAKLPFESGRRSFPAFK